jgi:AcrR family transcriptional regulator
LTERLSRDDRAALRKRRIIDTARTLFIERGFHSAGTALIAKEADVAVAQMYRDFPAKEDIVAAIVEQDCASLLKTEMLNHAIGNKDLDAVKNWIGKLLTPAQEDARDRLFIEIVAEVTRNPRIASVFKNFHNALLEHILSALTALAPQEDLGARRRNLADMIISFTLGLVHHRLMNDLCDVDPVQTDVFGIIDQRLSNLIDRA